MPPNHQDAAIASESSFADSLSPFRTDLFRFAARRTHNREDAEDITQQTLLQALRGLPGFRGLQLRAWLFSIARNLVNDRFREQERAEVVSLDELPEECLSRGPQQVRSICECRERLQHCFACFALQAGLEEQVALLLADVHGLSDKVSAARMSMPEPGFKWLLHQARRRLHRHAGGTCPLIGKTGSTAPCAAAPGAQPAGEQSVDRRLNGSSRPYRSGLSEGALEQLRRQLVRELGIN
jgi:RNA polymerase sigma-70 factor (ECF subfamily)